MKWVRLCPRCGQEVGKADIDFDDNLICIDCIRELQSLEWDKKSKWNNREGGKEYVCTNNN